MSKKLTNSRLTEEQAQMVNNNIGLVRYIANKLHSHRIVNDDFEDKVSIETIGLIKAVLNYDKSKGIKFTTFAVRCIENEIKMYFRAEKKDRIDVYLEEEIELNDSTVKLVDIIEDKKANFIKTTTLEKEAIDIINIILNCFNYRNQIVLLYWISGLKQTEIEEILGISQGYLSKVLKKATKKIKDILEQNLTYTKDVEILKIGDMYHLELPLAETDNINAILDDIHIEAKNKDMRYFKVIANEEKIIIEVLADPEYFFIIARIFSMIYK
ncbi:MAG: sigma-70 family RNA polymerase sigma factor [Clostridia bacterium]|nr:sigma-70 family RNA polymerase sigma factor [Clostridia bacterium]